MQSTGNHFSLKSIAGTAGIINKFKKVSKQAVWKRMSSNAENFMEKILLKVMENKVKIRNTKLKNKLSYFNRILIHDSTSIGLHSKLYDIFKGTANQNGKSCNLKIQAVIDLMKYSFVYFETTANSKNDQKASKNLGFLQKNDLIIRDLGYFVIESFRKIIDKKAFFISRLMYGVSMYSAQTGKKINLLQKLKKNDFLDIDILLSEKSKLPVRLIALKIPEKIAAERKRKLKNNRNSKMNPSKEHLECMGWSIYITNVAREVLTCDDINKIYAVRWEIEIIFKSWKGAFNFKIKKAKFSKEQVKILLFSRLIIITYITKIYTEYIDRNYGKNSIVSVLRFIIENFLIMFNKKQLINIKADVIKFISDNTLYEKRNRISLKEKIRMI